MKFLKIGDASRELGISISKRSGHGSIETKSLIEKHQVGTEWLTSRDTSRKIKTRKL